MRFGLSEGKGIDIPVFKQDSSITAIDERIGLLLSSRKPAAVALLFVSVFINLHSPADIH